MANQQHLDFLKQCIDNKDIEAWNKWRLDVEGLDEKDIIAIRDTLIKKVDLSKGSLFDLFDEEVNTINLNGGDLCEADLHGANLSRVDLYRADLSNADLSNANLSSANLSSANLSSANLSSANLSDADLSDADLSDANLSDANLRVADLSVVNLRGADLIGADLRGADLIGANLRDADLSNADLSGVDLSEAYLNNANFTNVTLSDENVFYAKINAQTKKLIEQTTFSKRVWGSVSKETQKESLEEKIEKLKAQLSEQEQISEEEKKEMQNQLEEKENELEKLTEEINKSKKEKEKIQAKIDNVFRFFNETYKQVDLELLLHCRLWRVYITCTFGIPLVGVCIYILARENIFKIYQCIFESEILIFIGGTIPFLLFSSMFATCLTQANRTRKIIRFLKEKKQKLESLKGFFSAYNTLSNDNSETEQFFLQQIKSIIERFNFYDAPPSYELASKIETKDETEVPDLLSNILEAVKSLR